MATAFDDTGQHPVTSTIAAVSQQLRGVADLGLWTLGSAETDANLVALAALRHQIAELELRHAHHAERVDLSQTPALLDTGDRITAGQARKLACEARIIPMVLGGTSQPLDLGRGKRLYDRHQRIAIRHRDQHCTAVGCEWPAALCHVHHNVPWSRGGRTDIADGRLLCPRHHTYAHSPKYEMKTIPNGRVIFSRT